MAQGYKDPNGWGSRKSAQPRDSPMLAPRDTTQRRSLFDVVLTATRFVIRDYLLDPEVLQPFR